MSSRLLIYTWVPCVTLLAAMLYPSHLVSLYYCQSVISDHTWTDQALVRQK